MMTLLMVLHVMVCFVLITVVLLQRGKGSDLGAALGGGGANTVFGGRGAGNFLTKITTGSAIIFMLTSLSLAYLGSQAADVQLFDSSDLEQSESAQDGLAPSAAGGEEGAAGELEDVGGLEEIPQPD
ncbi:MAG: preprotein translocase subunit SecG [Deltaproteobacteria bacterium]|nr:preprotein translocase subunit SecG [Deltaproteobacteria bacterium]